MAVLLPLEKFESPVDNCRKTRHIGVDGSFFDIKIEGIIQIAGAGTELVYQVRPHSCTEFFELLHTVAGIRYP